VDAISDDGRHALTVIAFVGSVFSPYYRRALRRNPRTDAADHCALNVCLYSPGANRWTMTERGERHVQRSTDRFVLGPSALHWQGDSLQIDIRERGMPMPWPVVGRVTVHAPHRTQFAAALDDAGRHRWRPLAPSARIEVQMTQPRLAWQGHAYLDSNEGDEPIEQGFTRWDWLRATSADGRTTVIYDTVPRQGAEHLIARQFAPDGSSCAMPVPARQALPPTRIWRINRQLRAEMTEGRAPFVARTLEDTPFYARSLIGVPASPQGPQRGRNRLDIVHETLDAKRLARTSVQWMLPFRMPRRS
jgi:carotenoid 1,2-hydratase